MVCTNRGCRVSEGAGRNIAEAFGRSGHSTIIDESWNTVDAAENIPPNIKPPPIR